MSAAAIRGTRMSASPPTRDAELNNNGPDVSGEEEEEDDEDDDPIEDDDASPIAYRTRSRSRSVSPHITRTKRTTTTTTTKQQTITFPHQQLNNQPPTLTDTTTTTTTTTPPQPIRPTYQPPSTSTSSVVFPLVTKRRLRFWIPLLVSLLLTALLIYMRAPRTTLHSSAATRWDSSGQHRTRREAVHNTRRSEYDQYASDQDDKEEMSKERARRIINEVHGVAAQIKQEAESNDNPPVYHPLKNAHPSAKDIARERKERGELKEDGWVMRTADWLGFGPYMRQEKREDGIHHMRGDDDHHTDKYDYIRDVAARSEKAGTQEKTNQHAKQSENETSEVTEKDSEKEGQSHANSILTHLKSLEERFMQQVESIKQRITTKTVPPYQQTTATPTTATTATAASEGDSSVPVQFISTSPDHPLLDPLHSILASVESLIARPVDRRPSSESSGVGWWGRLMDAVFPSSSRVSDAARGMYDKARGEASSEAGRVRRAMLSEYEMLKDQLTEIGAAVKSGKGEPLELYEQYNPEHVDTVEVEKVKAKAHTKEK